MFDKHLKKRWCNKSDSCINYNNSRLSSPYWLTKNDQALTRIYFNSLTEYCIPLSYASPKLSGNVTFWKVGELKNCFCAGCRSSSILISVRSIRFPELCFCSYFWKETFNGRVGDLSSLRRPLLTLIPKLGKSNPHHFYIHHKDLWSESFQEFCNIC